MDSHEVDYQIIGEGVQFVEIELDPEETVIAEAGAMLYMEQGIGFEAKMGDGTEGGIVGKLFGAAKRAFTNESIFMTHFTNEGDGKQKVAFSAPFPGQILAVDLAACGGELICQKDSFVCAAKGTRLSVAFSKRLGAGFFGGEGFILQRLQGDGMVFIHAGGSFVEKDLAESDLRVDTGCIVGFSGDVDYDIGLAGGLKSMLFGGEGLFLATLSGSGRVWLQSMPFSRMANVILEHASPASEQGED